MSEHNLIVNEEKKRFEIQTEGHTAFIDYILTKDNVMFLTHTEVPKALGGKGIASLMVEKTLRYIEEHNYKLAPLCPFVAKYLVKNPDWQKLLANGYNVSK